jgi:hypothetical protein
MTTINIITCGVGTVVMRHSIACKLADDYNGIGLIRTVNFIEHHASQAVHASAFCTGLYDIFSWRTSII